MLCCSLGLCGISGCCECSVFVVREDERESNEGLLENAFAFWPSGQLVIQNDSSRVGRECACEQNSNTIVASSKSWSSTDSDAKKTTTRAYKQRFTTVRFLSRNTTFLFCSSFLAGTDFKCTLTKKLPNIDGTYYFAAVSPVTGAIAMSQSHAESHQLCQSQGGTLPYPNQPSCIGYQQYLQALGLMSSTTPWKFFLNDNNEDERSETPLPVICQRKC